MSLLLIQSNGPLEVTSAAKWLSLTPCSARPAIEELLLGRRESLNRDRWWKERKKERTAAAAVASAEC